MCVIMCLLDKSLHVCVVCCSVGVQYDIGLLLYMRSVASLEMTAFACSYVQHSCRGHNAHWTLSRTLWLISSIDIPLKKELTIKATVRIRLDSRTDDV